MKAFASLTAQGQARRLYRLATAALDAYGLTGARMHLLRQGENVTYRVDIPQAAGEVSQPLGPYMPRRFLLRLHGSGYQTAATIRSECLWLHALQQEPPLLVPEPVRTLDGTFCTAVSAPGVPSHRLCSLLRWMRGRMYHRQPQPRHLTQLGRLMARLHAHARRWQPPADFVRKRWDWQGLFGPQGGFGVPAAEVWPGIPEPYNTPFWRVAQQLGETMQAWGDGPEVFGLIHADLGLGNALFADGEARAIDFDDCGFGYWMYDVAVALRRWRWTPAWAALRAAFAAGYTQVRALPAAQWAALDTFIAGRSVCLALWLTGRAREHAALRPDLPEWLAQIAADIAHYESEQKARP